MWFHEKQESSGIHFPSLTSVSYLHIETMGLDRDRAHWIGAQANRIEVILLDFVTHLVQIPAYYYYYYTFFWLYTHDCNLQTAIR